MRIALHGRNATSILGLGLLALALLSSWSTWRFVRGAERVEGRVHFYDGDSILIVEYETAPARKSYVLVRRPLLGPFISGKPLSILINPSVAHDPLHPEYYFPVPVIGRVASRAWLWAWPGVYSVLASSVLTFWALALLRSRRFRMTTRFHFDPLP